MIELYKKYHNIIQQIKAEKGETYVVTVEDIKKQLSVKEYPWQNV